MKQGVLMIAALILSTLFFLVNAEKEQVGAEPGGPPAQKILIKNVSLIITMEPDMGEGPLGIVKNSDILFDDTVLAVGTIDPAPGVEVIDGRGKFVLPGFVDVHNHLWQSLVRGCGADKELMRWLDECVFPFRGDLIDGKTAYAAVRVSTLDLISTGVTTVLDDSHAFNEEFTLGNVRALEASGMRFSFAYCHKIKSRDDEKFFHLLKKRIDGNPLASLQVCSHPIDAFLEDLKTKRKFSEKENLFFNVHLLESRLQIKEKPIELLDQIGAVNSLLFINHAVHLTDAQIVRLGKQGISVSHNPLSNMRLASGIMPLAKFRSAGFKIGLGLDGGTNDTSDMFNAMRIAVGLQRAVSMDPKVFPTVTDILRMATLGGAEALHLNHEIGSLRPGKRADLILFDPEELNFAPSWNPVNQIVLNGQPRNVKYVFVDGRPLVREGKPVLQGETVDELMHMAQKFVDHMKTKIKKVKHH